MDKPDQLTANYLAGLAQVTQALLRQNYQRLIAEGQALPSLDEVEFRYHSQNGEDGIIHYVFSVVGAGPKTAVEVCAGDGIQCNSANLIVNHGWEGLLVDGDADNIARGRAFYKACQDTRVHPPTIVQAWLTAENVDALIVDNGYRGEVGLLSIDIDGMDYWLWNGIKSIQPRLVVVEFNPMWGPELSVAVPYDPAFRIDYSKKPFFHSASLAAFCKLADSKGYRCIGAHRGGFNAFFLRNDLGREQFPALSAVECFRANKTLRNWDPSWLPSVTERPEYWATTAI